MATKTQHTPGPLEWKTGTPSITVRWDNTDVVLAEVKRPCWHEDTHKAGEEAGVNARLLAAAFTSYDKHCGTRAIECAEGDLLGELLKVCNQARCFAIHAINANVDLPGFDPNEHILIKAIDAAIAKAAE